jgi:hypothetical protein
MKRLIPIMFIVLFFFARVGLAADAGGGDPGKAIASESGSAGVQEKTAAPSGAFAFLPYPPAFGASLLLPPPEVPLNGRASPQSGPDTPGPPSSREKETPQPSFAFIDIAKAKDYREMDILRAAPKEHRAELFLGFRLLPDTEFLLGKGIRVERTPTDSFAPHDDGWRFKIKTNF